MTTETTIGWYKPSILVGAYDYDTRVPYMLQVETY
jgi:hypothetical protein